MHFLYVAISGISGYIAEGSLKPRTGTYTSGDMGMGRRRKASVTIAMVSSRTQKNNDVITAKVAPDENVEREEVKSWDRNDSTSTMARDKDNASMLIAQGYDEECSLVAEGATGLYSSKPSVSHRQDLCPRQDLWTLRSLSDSEKCAGGAEESKHTSAGVPVTVMDEEGGLPRVLIVDDAVSNRKMLSRLLRSRCKSVEEAADGQEALNKVLESLASPLAGKYDIIMMDFVMPIMDGPTATREMRKAGFTGYIFGLTGNVLVSDIEFFKAHGANYVLTKPFDVVTYDKIVAELRSG